MFIHLIYHKYFSINYLFFYPYLRLIDDDLCFFKLYLSVEKVLKHLKFLEFFEQEQSGSHK